MKEEGKWLIRIGEELKNTGWAVASLARELKPHE
jgi:hypothetical protein